MYSALRASLRLFKFNPIEFSPASAGMTMRHYNNPLLGLFLYVAEREDAGYITSKSFREICN